MEPPPIPHTHTANDPPSLGFRGPPHLQDCPLSSAQLPTPRWPVPMCVPCTPVSRHVIDQRSRVAGALAPAAAVPEASSAPPTAPATLPTFLLVICHASLSPSPSEACALLAVLGAGTHRPCPSWPASATFTIRLHLCGDLGTNCSPSDHPRRARTAPVCPSPGGE